MLSGRRYLSFVLLLSLGVDWALLPSYDGRLMIFNYISVFYFKSELLLWVSICLQSLSGWKNSCLSKLFNYQRCIMSTFTLIFLALLPHPLGVPWRGNRKFPLELLVFVNRLVQFNPDVWLNKLIYTDTFWLNREVLVMIISSCNLRT